MNVTSSSRATSGLSTPAKSSKKPSSGASASTRKDSVDQYQLDLSGLNLESKNDELAPFTEEPLPSVNYGKENLIEEVKRSMEAESKGKKKTISLIVIGRSQMNIRTINHTTTV